MNVMQQCVAMIFFNAAQRFGSDLRAGGLSTHFITAGSNCGQVLWAPDISQMRVAPTKRSSNIYGHLL